MKKECQVYKLSTSDLKILETVYLLNEKGIYPLTEGVYLILVGDDSPQIKEYSDLATYKTLVSYPSKKLSRLVMMLLRYHYLERIYDEASDELYLKVAEKGLVELVDYHKKHKYKFVQKKVKDKQLFLKKEKNWYINKCSIFLYPRWIFINKNSL